VCAAAPTAIRHLKTSNYERERVNHQRAARTKAVLSASRHAGHAQTNTTYRSDFVGEPEKCQESHRLALQDNGTTFSPQISEQ